MEEIMRPNLEAMERKKRKTRKERTTTTRTQVVVAQPVAISEPSLLSKLDISHSKI